MLRDPIPERDREHLPRSICSHNPTPLEPRILLVVCRLFVRRATPPGWPAGDLDERRMLCTNSIRRHGAGPQRREHDMIYAHMPDYGAHRVRGVPAMQAAKAARSAHDDRALALPSWCELASARSLSWRLSVRAATSISPTTTSAGAPPSGCETRRRRNGLFLSHRVRLTRC